MRGRKQPFRTWWVNSELTEIAEWFAQIKWPSILNTLYFTLERQLHLGNLELYFNNKDPN